MLSPKMLTLNLRDHLYEREAELIDESKAPKVAPVEGEEAPAADAAPTAELVGRRHPPRRALGLHDLPRLRGAVPGDDQYVDKIVDMRRNLVMVKGEFPHELQKTFRRSRPTATRGTSRAWTAARWADGLDVPLMSDKPDAEVLYWVGCAASYDDRAKKIARATAKLMKQAASTSPSSARRRPAPATPRAARATSTSS
jgi:hypothetical protein